MLSERGHGANKRKQEAPDCVFMDVGVKQSWSEKWYHSVRAEQEAGKSSSSKELLKSDVARKIIAVDGELDRFTRSVMRRELGCTIDELRIGKLNGAVGRGERVKTVLELAHAQERCITMCFALLRRARSSYLR